MRPDHRLLPRGRSRRGVAVTLAIAGFCVLFAGCSDQRITWLPYELVDGPVKVLRPVVDRVPGHGSLCADTDGDGLSEFLLCKDASVMRKGQTYPQPGDLWQMTFRPPFHLQRPVAQLCLDFDLEGDGVPEVLATACDTTHARHLTRVLDLHTGRIKAEFELSMVDSPYVDGRIDGHQLPLGGAGRNARGGQLAVMLCDAGFDSDNRAITAVDPTTGQIAWRYRLGPVPRLASSRVHDLDGDGRREILISGGGVHNLEGVAVNGAADDSSYVIVLDDRGRLLWQRAQARHPSGALIEVADIDGDGVSDLIVAGGTSVADRGHVQVHDGRDGTVMGRIETPLNVSSLLLMPERAGEPRQILITNRIAQAQRLSIDRSGRMELVDQVTFPGTLQFHGISDLLGDGSTQVLAVMRGHGRVVLDHELRTLALQDHEGALAVHTVHTVNLENGPPLLLDPALPYRSFILRRARWPWLMGGGLTLAGLPLLVLGIRARRNRRSPDDPAVQRELCLGLLGRLKTLRHEKTGTLENLERLLWFTDAAVQAAGPRTAPGAQILQLVNDTCESTLKRLGEVVSLARRVHVRDHRAASLDECCEKLEHVLQRYTGTAAEVDLAALAAEVKQLAQALEVATAAVREDVELRFRANLPEVVAGVLRGQTEALEPVTVSVQGAAVQPAVWQAGESLAVQVDPDDLVFILDNLVGNAARAMLGSATRALDLSWRAEGLAVIITVADTGCGIPPDDWSKVLRGEGSTREGGGFGFRRSREVLRLFRGALDILDSRPGRGTTFELRLPLAASEPERIPA